MAAFTVDMSGLSIGFTVGQQLYYCGNSQTLNADNKLEFGAKGEVTGPCKKDEARVEMKFPGNKLSIACLASQLRDTDPAADRPGGMERGTVVRFVGARKPLSNGAAIEYGHEAEVMGAAADAAKVGVRFQGINAVVPIYLTQLSKAWPPADLPGGYTVGQKLYYQGGTQKWQQGDKEYRLEHGTLGEVAGVNALDPVNKVEVDFPGAPGAVGFPLTHLSVEKPSALPQDFREFAPDVGKGTTLGQRPS
jgi:hypothetical protein